MPTKSGLKSGVVSRQELIYIRKCFLGHNEVVLSQRVVSRQEFYCIAVKRGMTRDLPVMRDQLIMCQKLFYNGYQFYMYLNLIKRRKFH